MGGSLAFFGHFGIVTAGEFGSEKSPQTGLVAIPSCKIHLLDSNVKIRIHTLPIFVTRRQPIFKLVFGASFLSPCAMGQKKRVCFY